MPGAAQASNTNKPNQETGLKLHAASGKVSAQAQSGPLKITADQTVTVASITKSITIAAKKHVLLTAGGAYLKIQGGNIEIHGPGAMAFKASMRELAGPGGSSPSLPVLPGVASLLPGDRLTMNNWIALDYLDPEGEPMADLGYKITFTTGQAISGKLDAKGQAHHENVPESTAKVEYEARTPKPDTPWDPLQQLVSAARSKLNNTQ